MELFNMTIRKQHLWLLFSFSIYFFLIFNFSSIHNFFSFERLKAERPHLTFKCIKSLLIFQNAHIRLTKNTFWQRPRTLDFPSGSDGEASAYNVGDLGSIPGSGRYPGEGNGNPLQYSCLENSWTGEPGRLQSMRSQRVGHN